MEMEETGEVEHEIEVDGNITIQLKIPLRVDALTFSAILEKARKILKLSEIEVKETRKRYTSLSDEEEQKFLEAYNTGKPIEELMAKYGYNTEQKLRSRINYLRKKHDTPTKRVGKSNFSGDDIKEMVKLIKKGIPSSEVGEKFGMTTKRVIDLIRYKTGKGILELRNHE